MSSPIEMLVEGKLAYWQYRSISTIENLSAGTGTLRFFLTGGVGNFFILDTLRLGADNYAGNRTLIVETVDEDSNSKLYLREDVAYDNVRKFIPSQDKTDNDQRIDKQIRYILIAGDDVLRIFLDALLVNETMTIALRCYIFNNPPTASFTVSGTNATVSTSTTLNKVVVS